MGTGDSFVHLHNHTEYSMLDGAAKVTPMLAEAKRLEMPAIGMTDHGNMFGASEFYNAAVKADIKPIIGIEAYIAPGSRFDTKRITWGDPSQKSDDVSASGAYLHMTMVAENATGLRNLFKLSSLASFEGQLGKWPRMDAEIIAEHSAGIIATTGCPSGEVQTRLRLGHEREALEAAARWREIFGPDNFFLELMDHGLSIETRVREGLLDELGRLLLVLEAIAREAQPLDAEGHRRLGRGQGLLHALLVAGLLLRLALGLLTRHVRVDALVQVHVEPRRRERLDVVDRELDRRVAREEPVQQRRHRRLERERAPRAGRRNPEAIRSLTARCRDRS
mgnify:CR=1 FL=1